MDTLHPAPAFHHPIPWQVVAALALIGCHALALVLQSAAALALFRSQQPPESRLTLLVLLGAATAAAANAVLGACIAARQDWARTVAVALSLLACFSYGAASVVLSFAAFATAPGVRGTLLLSAYGAFAFCLALLFLLQNERAAAYTYRGGGGDRPDE
ncbi:hypothetical protein GCM10009853_012710 [Glycomyces scopariae]